MEKNEKNNLANVAERNLFISNYSLLPKNMKIYIQNNIQNMDYKSLKTFVDVLISGYKNRDPATIKIVENFHKIDSVLKIILQDSLTPRSSTFLDLNSIKNNGFVAILNEIGGNEGIFAHELGHALLTIVDGINMPEEFSHIIFEIKESWSKNPQKLESFLQEARNYQENIYEKAKKDTEKIMEYNKADIESFIEKNLSDQNLLRKTLEQFYEKNKVDEIIKSSNTNQIKNIIMTSYRNEWGNHHFEELCNSDETMQIYQVLCGIIDSIYNGDNPYYTTIYDNGFLRTHPSSYFHKFPTNSFNEQFADYTRIKFCNMKVVIEIGKVLFGEAWFFMMETKYQQIANQLEQKTFGYDFDQGIQTQKFLEETFKNIK